MNKYLVIHVDAFTISDSKHSFVEAESAFKAYVKATWGDLEQLKQNDIEQYNEAIRCIKLDEEDFTKVNDTFSIMEWNEVVSMVYKV